MGGLVTLIGHYLKACIYLRLKSSNSIIYWYFCYTHIAYKVVR